MKVESRVAGVMALSKNIFQIQSLHQINLQIRLSTCQKKKSGTAETFMEGRSCMTEPGGSERALKPGHCVFASMPAVPFLCF